jgi:2'-5' RNA ligase
MNPDCQTSSLKRLFCAIKIRPDKGFISDFRKLKEAFRHEKIKWVEEQNIHVTLKFFGETEEWRIPEIIRVLDRTAKELDVFRISLRGLGIFGSSYEPRVVWTGIEPFRELQNLMQRMQEQLREIGYEPDRQNLVPHLTLGRIKYLKDKSLFRHTLDGFREISSETMTVDSYILYESILHKSGPEYIALKTFPFGD